jgi:hypothetical protein
MGAQFEGQNAKTRVLGQIYCLYFWQFPFISSEFPFIFLSTTFLCNSKGENSTIEMGNKGGFQSCSITVIEIWKFPLCLLEISIYSCIARSNEILE